MLSRSPAARVARARPQSLLRSCVVSGRQLQLRGAATFLAQQQCPTINARTERPFLSSRFRNQPWMTGSRSSYSSTANPADAEAEPTTPPRNRKDAIYAAIDRVNDNELEMASLMDELDLLDDHQGAVDLGGPELDDVFSQTIGHRDTATLEARVLEARQLFGDTLPEGYLNDTEMQLYTSLYGEPIVQHETEFEGLEEEAAEEEEEGEIDRLYREDGQGGWEEIEYAAEEQDEDGTPVVYDMEAAPLEEESLSMQRAREVAEQLGGEVMMEEFADEANADPTPRLHPLTEEAKSGTDPSTVFPPKDALTGPISTILSDFSNKHISETAHGLFGGRNLPYSTTTLPLRAMKPQAPIPLDASQRYMSEMEANAFLAVLYPGMYASVLSVLVEVRKRLGSDWLRGLMAQEGGPHVLDASAGGAGILAWRDVLRAEYELMVPDHPEGSPIPVGRSAVVTGSDTLRMRASAILENTSFLPRLPDYVHSRMKPTLEDKREPRRKQYDVIIAPHSLLGLEEDYIRKEQVENLWNLLNPDGGVLILLEKGHQRGFEAIAGAREMLLKRHIASPGSTHYEDELQSPRPDSHVEKEQGMIVAPCTNHEQCPMYHMPGQAKGRRDFCHFQQRYIRPQFLQRIIGSRDRNHEDVSFSYVAVQRGVDLRETDNIVQGQEAADAAFEGYEHLHDTAAETADAPQAKEESSKAEDGEGEGEEGKFSTLSLPRIVYPPMKRRGHVIFDMCTPAGKIERWTVPRSFSKRAYKDARKARWGDLWALGAKTRIARSLRLGDRHGEGKKERMARRAAARADMEMDADAEADEAGENLVEDGGAAAWPVLDGRNHNPKGTRIPSWKKHADRKTMRQAEKKHAEKRAREEVE